MLRKTRIFAAILIFVSTTLLFVDFTGALHHGAGHGLGLGWAAKIQLIPALLAANGILLSVLAALTLLFGRVYCSVICPLGIMQDIVSRLSSFRRDKKKTLPVC